MVPDNQFHIYPVTTPDTILHYELPSICRSFRFQRILYKIHYIPDAVSLESTDKERNKEE